MHSAELMGQGMAAIRASRSTLADSLSATNTGINATALPAANDKTVNHLYLTYASLCALRLFFFTPFPF